VTVTVPTPPPAPTNNYKYQIGDRVVIKGSNINTRATPSLTGIVLGVHQNGDAGTILAAPVTADGYTWWKIDFDSGVDGWSVDNYIATSTTTGPTYSSYEFKPGDRVKTVTTLNVRMEGNLSAALIGVQSYGAQGTIIGGGVFADGYYWWSVNFDVDPDGWSAGEFLVPGTNQF
jgi:hypothetical protein